MHFLTGKTEMDLVFLKRAIDISKEAKERGNKPFGAVLVDSFGNILVEQENITRLTGDCTAHAETVLIRRASQKYDQNYLWTCTLYTSAESCVMCAAAIYLANIGRVVYGLETTKLLRLMGENSLGTVLPLRCREILAIGDKKIEVVGPLLEEEAAQVHEGYWG